MRKLLALSALCLPALCLLAAPARAEGMKAGLWEVKMLKQVVDGRDMAAQMAAARAQMQQQMASLPPEQRKRVEAMLGGQGAAPGATRVCISKEMAARDEPMVDPEGQCRTTRVSRSGNTVRFEFDCRRDGSHTAGKGENTFSGNTMHSRLDMTLTDARGRHIMQSESQMTWLGPDCKGLAPLDAARR